MTVSVSPQELGDAYAEAWREWEESADARDWESTAADGLSQPSQ